ncbi:Putative neutral zinc metallopeptidase [Aureliella helgolandensis]|uniref:Neutral zinc metallopeptidase n=2 Tax=Aureliella helgolandensis TaxID=2527968 RepID=A0A518G4L8_9BACT|nr:Putative neutral zinc metallopeptidase [Aureliella helgolandensis]
MRWAGREGSSNVEDRRSMKSAGAVGGGGLLVALLVVVFSIMRGGDPGQALQDGVRQLQQQAAQGGAGAQAGAGPVVASEAEQELAEFVKVVLKDTEDVWNDLFPRLVGKEYQEPKLILFRNATSSGCGHASSAVGPFYCPADLQVYLDLAFFEEMRTKFKAPGDFACAYVVAHEVGHHVQNLLGLSAEVQSRQAQLSKAEANKLSVRLELQADFLAGVWAHHADRAKRILEAGDVEEALNAAQQIGDDTLQRQATGQVMPDSFTHGTAKQRQRWFNEGLQSGDLSDLNLLFELDYNRL